MKDKMKIFIFEKHPRYDLKFIILSHELDNALSTIRIQLRFKKFTIEHLSENTSMITFDNDIQFRLKIEQIELNKIY